MPRPGRRTSSPPPTTETHHPGCAVVLLSPSETFLRNGTRDDGVGVGEGRGQDESPGDPHANESQGRKHWS